jgi:DNA polymerase-3 subunit beta
VNFTVDRAEFLAELQLCASITPRRPTIAILCAVRIEAADGRVRLAATDLDITILTSCAAEVTAPGAVAIEAQVLLEMVRSLDGETVTIALDGTQAVISGGGATFETNRYDADDYPVLPEIAGEAAQTMELATLQAMLSMTSDALGEDDHGLALSRVCLRFRDGEITTSAVCGHWLAKAWTAGERKPGVTVYGLTRQAVRLLGKFAVAGNANAEAWFTANESHVAITCDGRTVMDRQRDLNFPDYDNVFPKVTDRAIVNRETLLDVVARANVTAKGANSKFLRLTFSAGKLGVHSKNAIRGEFRESVPVEFTGEETVAGYDGGYLADALRLMTSNAVELGLARHNGASHLFVTPTTESDIHQLAVIASMGT